MYDWPKRTRALIPKCPISTVQSRTRPTPAGTAEPSFTHALLPSANATHCLKSFASVVESYPSYFLPLSSPVLIAIAQDNAVAACCAQEQQREHKCGGGTWPIGRVEARHTKLTPS